MTKKTESFVHVFIVKCHLFSFISIGFKLAAHDTCDKYV